MSPRLRPWLPVLLPFVAGALAYLLLGDGPHAGQARPADAADWSLPAPPARGTEAARAVWLARSPWGQETGLAEAAPDALALSPVGFVTASGRAVALFARADGQVVRASLGDALPDGSRVTELDAAGVAWADALGRTQRRAWLVDVVAAPAEEPAAAPRGRAGRTPGQGPGNRGARNGRNEAPGAARERRQRRAPSAVAPTMTRPTSAPTTTAPATTAPATTRAPASSTTRTPPDSTSATRPPSSAPLGAAPVPPGQGGAAEAPSTRGGAADASGGRPSGQSSSTRSAPPRG